MAVPQAPISALTDGVSTTMLCIEDAGRTDLPYNGNSTTGALSKYAYATSNNGGPEVNPDGNALVVVDSATACTGGATPPCHGVWRWADMDAAGSGISGRGTAALS